MTRREFICAVRVQIIFISIIHLSLREARTYELTELPEVWMSGPVATNFRVGVVRVNRSDLKALFAPVSPILHGITKHYLLKYNKMR